MTGKSEIGKSPVLLNSDVQNKKAVLSQGNRTMPQLFFLA